MKRVVLIAAALAALASPMAARADVQSTYSCEGLLVMSPVAMETTSCEQALVPGTRRFKVLWTPGSRGSFHLEILRASDRFVLGTHACTFVPNDVDCDTTGSLEGGNAVYDTVEGALTRGNYQAYAVVNDDAIVTFATEGLEGPPFGAKVGAGVVRLEGS